MDEQRLCALSAELLSHTHFAARSYDVAFAQSCFDGILSDVSAEVLKLQLVAHDVIEGLPLPERAATGEEAVDIEGAPAFPVTDNLAERALVGGFDQRMKMIRHEAPRIELIGRAVSGGETCDEEVGAGRAGEEAFTVAGVEEFVKFRGELAPVFLAFLVSELRELTRAVDAMSAQPGLPLEAPFIGDDGGHGIREARGDEVSDAPLPPVWELLAVDVQFTGVIKRTERHDASL